MAEGDADGTRNVNGLVKGTNSGATNVCPVAEGDTNDVRNGTDPAADSIRAAYLASNVVPMAMGNTAGNVAPPAVACLFHAGHWSCSRGHQG